MTEQKKVYVVMSGQYSDRGIDAIYDDRALAEKHVETHNQHNGNTAYVHEWPVNQRLLQNRVLYQVILDEWGDVVSQWSAIEWSPDSPAQDCTPWVDEEDKRVWGKSYRGFNIAIKSARDKLAQWKAEQAGV